MSEQTKTLTRSDIIQGAAEKQNDRVTGSMPKGKTNKSALYDRSMPDKFNPKRVVAYQNPQFGDDVRACWLKDDGKTPDPKTQAEYQFPPMLIARGSKIVGEGDAFKEVTNKKGVFISRGAAHFRLVLVKEVSDEMAEIYPDWRAAQEKCVRDVREASIKLITDTFEWKNPPNNWVPFRNAALKSARNSLTIPDRKKMNDSEIDDYIEARPELKKELKELALEFYIKEARFPFKPQFDDTTKQEKQAIASIECKVYATADFKDDVYFNKNDGPDDITFPSDNEHIGAVIEMMRTLQGKGGKGVDTRVYTPMKFVNQMAKKEPTKRELALERKVQREYEDACKTAIREGRPKPPPPPKNPDPIEDRPNVKLSDGTLVPDRWWNPTAVQNGKPVQSYGVAVGGFYLTASEIGGYGTKFIHRDKRRVYVLDYEDVPERDIGIVGKRTHETMREEAPVDDEDDDDDEPRLPKRSKTGDEEGEQQRQHTELAPEATGAENEEIQF